MERTFKVRRKDDETMTGCCTRTARTARTMWKQMKPPFFAEFIAEGRWRAMGMGMWPKTQRCSGNSVARVCEGSSCWWKNTNDLNVMVVTNSHTTWKHNLGWYKRGIVWDKLASPTGQGQKIGRKTKNLQDGRARLRDAMQ